MMQSRAMTLPLFQFTHPRGVRLIPSSGAKAHSCFNSRTHEGCDAQEIIPLFDDYVFQFTHPQGVRQEKIS